MNQALIDALEEADQAPEPARPEIYRIYHNVLRWHPVQGIRHAMDDLTSDIREVRDEPEFYTHDFRLVAQIEFPQGTDPVQALSDCYRLTNSIDMPWRENPEVTYLGTCLADARSLSTGDAIQGPDGTWHMVASVGFKTVTVKTYEEACEG